VRHERGADLRCLKYVRQLGASIVPLIMRQVGEALPESLQVIETSVSSI
jgi:glutaredoxin 2